MPLPVTGGRGDAVIMVEWDPVGAVGVFTNWCGAKNASLSIQNEISSDKQGDCDDWSLPVQTIRRYSGQSVTASMDATWTAAQNKQTMDWALNQKKLNVRVHFPNSAAGQIEYVDGAALLSGLELGELGNTEGENITENVSLEFDGVVTTTDKV